MSFFLKKINIHLLTELFQIQLQEATAMTAHPSAAAQQPAQGKTCLNYRFPPWCELVELQTPTALVIQENCNNILNLTRKAHWNLNKIPLNINHYEFYS